MKKLLVFTVLIMLLIPIPAGATNVIYYSQKDYRWANITLACQDGITATVYNAGCGETVVSMLLSTYVDSKYTPDVVIRDYFSDGYFCHGTDWEQDLAPLRANNFSVIGISEEDIAHYLQGGWLVFANVQNHYILIIGLDKAGRYLVFDPFYGISTWGENYPYTMLKTQYAIRHIYSSALKEAK